MLKHSAISLTFIFGLFLSLFVQAQGGNPSSDNDNDNDDDIEKDGVSVYEGKARFTVITPSLIRLEYSPNKEFEERPTQTLGERPPASTDYTTRVQNGHRVVQTSELTLKYEINSGPFDADNLSVEFTRGNSRTTARPKWDFSPQEGNLGGWLRGLDKRKKPLPLNEGVLSREGWYLINDSRTVLLSEENPFPDEEDNCQWWDLYCLAKEGLGLRPDNYPGFYERRGDNRSGDYRDGYFFAYGEDYVQGLKDLRTLTGAAPLAPKKALGVWFSKWEALSANDWKELVDEFEERNIPLETISIDTDFKRTMNYFGCLAWNAIIQAPLLDPCSWNGWDWNKRLYPDPKGFIDFMHDHDIDVGLNIHPSIYVTDPKFYTANRKTGFTLKPDLVSDFRIDFGLLPCGVLTVALIPCYVFDWTQKSHLDSYFDLHRDLRSSGIDFWWLDWCCEGTKAQARGLSADTWINKKYKEDHVKMGSRWPAFSRIGGSFQNGLTGKDNNGVSAFGEHRYSMHFTGDTCSDWELMAAQAAMTVAEGNIGLPYVSHDIGSFVGDKPGDSNGDCNNQQPAPKLPDDMYVRWMQFGTFQPIMRLHSHHGKRLPWEYPGKPEGIASDFLRLRGQLVPFLYTLSREAYDTGIAITRPLYLQWPQYEESYDFNSQYTLGDDVLVATVAAPGDPATIDLWIPPGEWINYFTGESFVGPQIVSNYQVALEDYAVFMKRGSILTLRPHEVFNSPGPQDSMIIQAWAGRDNADATLYEDEGRGFAYKDGDFQKTKLSLQSSSNNACHTLRINPIQGSYFDGAVYNRKWEVQFMATDKPKRVKINNQTTKSWSYDSSKRIATIEVPATRTQFALNINVCK